MTLLHAVTSPEVVEAMCSDLFCCMCELVGIAFCWARWERYSYNTDGTVSVNCKAHRCSRGVSLKDKTAPAHDTVAKLQSCITEHSGLLCAKSSVISVCCGRSCWERLLSMQGLAGWHSAGTASLRIASADEKLTLTLQLCDRASSKSSQSVHPRIDFNPLSLQGGVFLSLA